MKNQIGARFVAKQRLKALGKEPVLLQHYRSEIQSIQVSKDVRKRKKYVD